MQGKSAKTAAVCTYFATLNENSNFLSGPLGEDPLDFEGASFGGSLGWALDEPVIYINTCHSNTITHVLHFY